MKEIIFILLVGLTLSYNPSGAINYARTYCRNYNPQYYNYRNQGGDCANFVSQCLIAGGERLDGCSGKDGKGAIPLVSDLRNCLSSRGWRYSTGINDNFKAGYPFFQGTGHAMIATTVNGKSIKFCGHTNDRCDMGMTAPTYYDYFYQ